ncbi:MAG: hypothetical protein AAFY91_01165 [Bacteroidota bacterium]
MTQKQIDGWKTDGLRPVAITFDDGKVSYFKSPNRVQLKLILSKTSKGGPVEMVIAFAKNCLLAGDVSLDEIASTEDTTYSAQMVSSLDDLLGTAKAEVKKL